MDFVYVLLPLALFLGFIGLMGFMWALKSGQYDDLDGAAWRAIMDDDEDLIPTRKKCDKPVNNPQNPVDNPPKQQD
ncbi:MAG: cbb3-type cytochrome oxidase assembly protein CcoS [Hyphomicrobiaceae bacterium]|nr:cbb3-type cytochrome oxidase assembly protein CcoS [Hyphomicrobiaceae bacterium]